MSPRNVAAKTPARAADQPARLSGLVHGAHFLAEDAVKQATQQYDIIFKKWASKA